MSNNGNDLGNLFGDLQGAGIVQADTAALLNVTDFGQQINAAMGVDVNNVDASEVFLVTLLLDDSTSIRMAGNTDNVRKGHDLVMEAFRGAQKKQQDSIFVHARCLNSGIVYPYIGLADVANIGASFNPSGGTPLYDQVIVTLGTVLKKAEEFALTGVNVRTATLILTDGADYGSNKRIQDAAKVVRDVLMAETHIVAAMGIDDGQTDFHKVFTDMNIRPEWILTPGNSGSDIRKAFELFSQSAVQASQSVGSFSKTSLGGFGS